MAQVLWTESEAIKLAELWYKGATIGQIAVLLRTTKNAIAGKVHRMQLRPRRSNQRKPITRSLPKTAQAHSIKEARDATTGPIKSAYTEPIDWSRPLISRPTKAQLMARR